MTEEQNKDLTREERLEIEEKAIQALIDMGVKFSVPLKINPVNPPKRIVWWNKHFPNHVKIWRDRRLPKNWDVSLSEVPDANLGKLVKVYMRNFHIKPLYLGTIDILRRFYIQIEYDEQAIQDQPIQESKKLFKYIPVMAEIAAIAVVNNFPYTNPLANSKEVKELKQFFIDNLTVARLQRLVTIINQMMNPGGFTSSIRLIKEIGTTKPKNKEENNRADLIE